MMEGSLGSFRTFSIQSIMKSIKPKVRPWLSANPRWTLRASTALRSRMI